MLFTFKRLCGFVWFMLPSD